MVEKPHKAVNSRYERQKTVCLFLTPEGVDTKTLSAILMTVGAEMVAETGKGYCLHCNRDKYYNPYICRQTKKAKTKESLNRSTSIYLTKI